MFNNSKHVVHRDIPYLNVIDQMQVLLFIGLYKADV